jgi:hypothetical protein
VACFTACSSPSGGSRSSSGDCVPGYTRACFCPGGASGSQTCLTSGDGFEDCDCGGEPAPDTDAVNDAESDADGSQSSSDLSPPQDPGPSGGEVSGPDCESDDDCPAEAPQCAPQGICLLCYPGTLSCDGSWTTTCAADGSEWVQNEDCAQSGKVCNAVGACADPCGGFAKLEGTNAGCDFYAVDLRNGVEATPAVFLDAQDAQFAVIVSNASEQVTAEITVTSPDGTQQKATLPPQTLTPIMLPPTWGQEGSGRSMSAFRIQSTASIVAYQFNPLSNEGVFSNDASLLLPRAVAGTDYRVVTRAHWSADHPAYFAVIGAADVAASVTITPTAPTKGGGGLPALSAGESWQTDLAPGEVIVFEGASGDLTGSRVQSDLPVMVFGGHTASRTSDECCADHLEHQLPPTSAWGTEYVVGRSVARNVESDYVRVVARENDTVVTVSGAAYTLQAGEFMETAASGHIRITSNKPVLVAQFLASAGEICGGFGCSSSACSSDDECGTGMLCAKDFATGNDVCRGVGDPAMILAVPVAQWQTDFVVLTPSSYLLDYATIVSHAGAFVSLDGALLQNWETVPGSAGFQVWRGPLTDGVHVIQSESQASVMVHGYDRAVSYGYAGAMRVAP